MSATDLPKEFITKRLLVLWMLFAVTERLKSHRENNKLHKEVLCVFLYRFNEGMDSVTELQVD